MNRLCMIVFSCGCLSSSALCAFILYNDSPCLVLELEKKTVQANPTIKEIPPLTTEIIPETKENCAAEFKVRIKSHAQQQAHGGNPQGKKRAPTKIS